MLVDAVAGTFGMLNISAEGAPSEETPFLPEDPRSGRKVKAPRNQMFQLQTTSKKKKGTGRTPEQIRSIWNRWVTKLFWILRHLQHSESTMAVLSHKTTDKDGGQTIYNLHFGHLTS